MPPTHEFDSYPDPLGPLGSKQMELTVGTGATVLVAGVELVVLAVQTPTVVVAGGAIGGFLLTQSDLEQLLPTQLVLQ